MPRFIVYVALMLVVSPAFSSPKSKEAVTETLLWLREREQFEVSGCRLANREDVRDDKNCQLGDVILTIVAHGREGLKEVNMGYYIRIRKSETASDTLGSRLSRMGLSLDEVPISSCELWPKGRKK